MNPNEKAAYEARERADHALEVRRIDTIATRSAQHKRRMAGWALALQDMPELVADRVDWLLEGHYGHGAYLVAWDHVNETGTNEAATIRELLVMIGVLEWMCSQKGARHVIDALSAKVDDRSFDLVTNEVATVIARQKSDDHGGS